MTVLLTIFILLLLLGLFEQHSYMKFLIWLSSMIVLVKLTVQHVLTPFVHVVAAQLKFVPHSQLLIVCGITLFLANVVTELLKQCDLESYIPFSDVTIRFLLFMYCLEQLKPTITQMTQLLARLT